MSLPEDVDRAGLVTTALRWTPETLRADPTGLALVTAYAYALAHLLNPCIDGERYLPLIFNPARCLDNDIGRVLEMNGVRVRPGSFTTSKLRRLAVIAPILREWRGAFRAHRTVASALTGGPVIVRSWVQQRAIMDVSTMSIVLLDEDDADTTQMFVLAQGPGADPDYSAAEIIDRLEELAMPVLDSVELVECFALTAWRNGVGGWVTVAGADWPERIGSSVEYEFESIDVGPDVSADADQFIGGPTTAPVPTTTNSWWTTIWFKTVGAAVGDRWEHWLFGTDDGPNSSGDGYVVHVPSGAGQTLELYRVVGGTYTSFGTHTVTITDGDADAWHRIDVVIERSSVLAARARVYVDHDPSPWFDDTDPVVGRPNGRAVFAGTRSADFTSGRLRIAAVTAQFREDS